MTKTDFTTAPWEARDCFSGRKNELFAITTTDGEDLAILFSIDYSRRYGDYEFTPFENAKSNAHLMAAAPDMYVAAANLIADVRRRHPNEPLHCEYMLALDAALSKARGDVGVNKDD